jgi:hypothetical protein
MHFSVRFDSARAKASALSFGKSMVVTLPLVPLARETCDPNLARLESQPCS